MLAKVAKHYGLGPVTAIDPHNMANVELESLRSSPGASTYGEFLANLKRAGVDEGVRTLRAYSTAVAREWKDPIRLLWIDGDHSYEGAKADFDGFTQHLIPGGIVAFHDALHPFTGPIRVFVEDVLRSDEFGTAGFVGSIAWAQYRTGDGERLREGRARLERLAAPLIPLTAGDGGLHGIHKILYKLRRARVPRAAITPEKWVALLNS
jgi:hypothetical protein